MSHRIYAAAAVAAYVLSASPTWAQGTTIYDFGSVPQDTTVTPYTLQGATFSSPSDAASGGTFTFGPNSGLYSTLGNSVLSSAGNAILGDATELDVSFAQAQTGLTFDYAIGDFLQENGGDSLTVTTNTGYSQTFTNATIPANSNDLFPQAAFSLAGGTPFTAVSIIAMDDSGPGGTAAQEDLAIADMTSTPAVPVPATLLLFAGGLLGLGWRRRAVRTAAAA